MNGIVRNKIQRVTHMEDRASMAYSLETRVPNFDNNKKQGDMLKSEDVEDQNLIEDIKRCIQRIFAKL